MLFQWKFAGTFNLMKENEITALFGNHPNLEGLLRAFGDAGSERIRLEGLTGSSKAIIVAGVFLRTQNTHLVIIPEKEDAAYFYNDLVSLVGSTRSLNDRLN